MKHLYHILTLGALAVLGAAAAAAPLKVVTTDTNLADIASKVGGDRVRVESLSRGTDDPHQVEPRPSMVVKLASADVFARIGMDLDLWADGILERCGNRKVQKGGPGYADCSANIRVLEVPTTRLDPSMGDIHVYGNPHYLLDPANGIVAAGNIAAALIRVDPAGQAYYRKRFLDFGEAMKQHLEKWQKALAGLKGQSIVVYHRNWIYFTKRFGLVEFSAIEPKPGVPPSPGYVQGLIRLMKAHTVRIVLCETFRSHQYPDMIAAQTGARAVFVPLAVGGEAAATDYFALFDVITSRLASGARQP